MFKKLLIVSMLLSSTNVFAWGKIGHRVVGEIAQRNLSKDAKKGVQDILGTDSLAQVANWADEIRSNPSYNYSGTWHYVNFPFDKTYFDQKRAETGDVLEALYRQEEILRNPKATAIEKAEALKFMVHFMGDIHQPMHVGQAEDRGGNTIRVNWFGENVTLHSLWDEKIVNFEELSFTEYATFLNHFTKDEKKDLAKGNFLDWAMDSRTHIKTVYDVGENNKPGYEYHHKIKPLMEARMKLGGLRLATVLNNIFEKKALSKEYIELRQKIYNNK